MTPEQKQKLEQAAWEHVKGFTGGGPIDIEIRQTRAAFRFKCGAQTILDAPGEWGLEPVDNAKVILAEAYYRMQAEIERYREALERISALRDEGDPSTLDMELIAKEALKQEDITCPKCGYPLFKHLGKTCCQGCNYAKQQ